MGEGLIVRASLQAMGLDVDEVLCGQTVGWRSGMAMGAGIGALRGGAGLPVTGDPSLSLLQK